MPRAAWPWVRGVGLVAAALGALGDAYHLYWAFVVDGERSELLTTAPYRAHGILIAIAYALALFALAGLSTLRRDRLPRAAWAGALVAFVGTTLVAGDYWAESAVTPAVVASAPTLADAGPAGADLAIVIAAFGLLAAGWLTWTIVALRSQAFPRAPLLALAVGSVVAFTPFAGSNILLFLAVGWLAAVGARSDATA